MAMTIRNNKRQSTVIDVIKRKEIKKAGEAAHKKKLRGNI